VDIYIHAGVSEITNGDFGLGFFIFVKNNLNEPIEGEIIIFWNLTNGMNVRIDNLSFKLSPFNEIKFSNIDWLHFPFPILKIMIIVSINEYTVSKSGIEIGPVVLFSD
jgi:hypothetical protein